MTDLTGITVTPGVLPEQLRASLETAVERIGGRIVDTVRIDTTHFVCTEGRGKDWERAKEMNIPVVRPEWVEGCEREGRIVGVRGYYLDANPKHRQVGSNPQLMNNAVAGSSNVTVGAKGSQTDLPERRAAPPTRRPRDPAEEEASHVGGEDDGPGPEVLPSPLPTQDDGATRSPVSAEAGSIVAPASGSAVSEEEEDEAPAETAGEPGEEREHVRQEKGKRSEASINANVEDEREGGGAGSGHDKMHDVEL